MRAKLLIGVAALVMPGSAGATRRVDDESKPSSGDCCAADVSKCSARG